MGPSMAEAERELIDRAKNAWLEVQWLAQARATTDGRGNRETW